MGIENIVKLASKERQELEHLVRFGVSPAKKILRARILLESDQDVGHVRDPHLVDSCHR